MEVVNGRCEADYNSGLYSNRKVVPRIRKQRLRRLFVDSVIKHVRPKPREDAFVATAESPDIDRHGRYCSCPANARLHLLPEAGAQRTLEAVRCKPLLGVFSECVALPIVHLGNLTQNPVGIVKVEFLAPVDNRLRLREFAPQLVESLAD